MTRAASKKPSRGDIDLQVLRTSYYRECGIKSPTWHINIDNTDRELDSYTLFSKLKRQGSVFFSETKEYILIFLSKIVLTVIIDIATKARKRHQSVS